MTQYETSLYESRQYFRTQLQKLVGTATPKMINLFLIYYCALGVRMTDSVPEWITRASERCHELGYSTLAEKLYRHAKHEENHHQLLMNDAIWLLEKWHHDYPNATIDLDQLLNQSSSSVQQYRTLHEETISSETPYCQIAIEYEIERISVDHGPSLLSLCDLHLRDNTSQHLSFLQDHIKLDIAHTQYNEKLLNEFLADYPKALNPLIAAGKKALNTYLSYLMECYQLAVLTHREYFPVSAVL